MAHNIVGVDFSNWGIRAVEVRDAATTRPTIMRSKSILLPEGAVLRGEVVEVATVATALRQLWSTGGFTSKDVVLGIGNHRVLARDLSVPKMSLVRIRESLPFQVQEMLPVPVEDALLDFYPISESHTEQGPMVNGLLVAAIKEAVATNVKAAEQAGLNPIDVDLIPFALSRVLLRGTNVSGVVAIIEVGANTSTVIIAKDGVPQFVRIIATGGSDLTDAIRAEGSLTTEQAETTKRALGLSTVGVAIEQRPIVEVIYKVAGELLTSIRNTLNYFASARPADPVRQIILTGGGARLIGFAQALQENTRIPIVFGDPFTMVAADRRFRPDNQRGDADSVSVALGLALGSAA
jgi:type IV pilus assembly protein PilM